GRKHHRRARPRGGSKQERKTRSRGRAITEVRSRPMTRSRLAACSPSVGTRSARGHTFETGRAKNELVMTGADGSECKRRYVAVSSTVNKLIGATSFPRV